MRLLHAVWFAAFATAPVACAAILGDDFEIVATGSGEGGAGAGVTSAGGSGGSAGGGGSEPRPYYSCTWDFPEHRLVRSLETEPGSWLASPFTARRGPDSVRAVIPRGNGSETFVDIYTLDSSANIATASFPGGDIHQVERLSSVNVGVLYTRYTPSGPEIRLLVIADSSADGQDANDILLATPASLPGFDGSLSYPEARMAAVPLGGIDDFDVDVVISYQNNLDQYAIHYARYVRDPLPTFVRITDPASNLNSNDIQPAGIAHYQGNTYAYFGDTNATQGLVVYTIDGSVTGYLTGAPIGQGELLGPIVVLPPDYANVVMLDAGPPIRFLTGAVAAADLGTFDPSDLHVAAEFATLLDLPVFEVDAYWHEDIFTMIGPDADRSLDLAYYFLDNEGNERAQGSLDFTAQLPAEEDRVDFYNLSSSLRGEPLDATGGTLHVIWTESHTRNSQDFDVAYYDRLRCTPE